jgi:SAM-dependent methyltransferase
MNCVKKYIDLNYFKSKTLLELGCGYAHIGNIFYTLGADVTSSDARQEHLTVVKRQFPHLKTLRLDCDKEKIPQVYDIIIHWGLLYHLADIEDHLADVCEKCTVLFLESVISDSTDESYYKHINENGYDRAFNLKGILPSPPYIEKVLKKNGFEVQLILDPILNTGIYNYTRELKNTKTSYIGFRRFWICWKEGTPCPLVAPPAAKNCSLNF